MRCAYFLILSLASLTLFSQTGLLGQTSAPPKAEAKVKYYCPVIGVPEANGRCSCASGYYCSLEPKSRDTIPYQGAKLQFCCGGCIKMFKKAPARFAVSAHHQLVATKQATQTKCPLCGGAANAKVGADIAGLKVHFCSEECLKKVNGAKMPDRLDLIFGDKAFARGFAVLQK